MDQKDFGRSRRVVIAGTTAHCTRCGGEEFVRSNRKAADKADSFLCTVCGTQHSYGALLAQIAATVIARSERLLAELQKAHAERMRKR